MPRLEERHPELIDDLRTARIQALAHRMWEAEGCPEGRDEEFWLRAEREIVGWEAPNPDVPPP